MAPIFIAELVAAFVYACWLAHTLFHAM